MAELEALSQFSADVLAAFAEAALRQRDSLTHAQERLAGLARRPQAAVEWRTAQDLKMAITRCVADAAAENVAIWAALTERLQADCAQYDQARTDDRAAADPDGAGDEPPRRARG